MAVSARGLFHARRGSGAEGGIFDDLPKLARAADRDPLDYDPTPASASAPFLAAEAEAIRAHTGASGLIWEPAVGGGHLARAIEAAGFSVFGSDVVDRGFPGVALRGFYDWKAGDAPSRVQITNPPFCEISAKDGKGHWLRHAFATGARYVALLLGSEWCNARINGHDALFRDHPPTVEYVCCFRIDFRGKGAPPQANSWFVWDTLRPPIGPDAWIKRRLLPDLPDDRQGAFNV